MLPPTGQSRSRDGEKLNLAHRHGCRRAVQDTSCSWRSTRYASPVCLVPKGFPKSVPPACSISTVQNPAATSCAHRLPPVLRIPTHRSFCARASHSLEIPPPGKRHPHRPDRPISSLRAALLRRRSPGYAVSPAAPELEEVNPEFPRHGGTLRCNGRLSLRSSPFRRWPS